MYPKYDETTHLANLLWWHFGLTLNSLKLDSPIYLTHFVHHSCMVLAPEGCVLTIFCLLLSVYLTYLDSKNWIVIYLHVTSSSLHNVPSLYWIFHCIAIIVLLKDFKLYGYMDYDVLNITLEDSIIGNC